MRPISPRDLIRHELIGLNVQVVDSPNSQLVGCRGVVVDETKKTLVLDDGSGEKIVPKDSAAFLFRLGPNSDVRVEGVPLLGRPEERLKKKVKAW